MKMEWPEGVEDIVKSVGERLKAKRVMGASGDADEDAALEVTNRIKTEWMHADPRKTIEIWDWAARQHFKLLLADWRRFDFFRDHRLCEPKGKDEAKNLPTD